MKFTAETNDLIASLNILAKAQKKGIATAISSIKFNINENNTLTMTINDGDVRVTTSLDITNIEVGSFMANADQFAKMIKGVPNQTIELTCNDKYAITIKYNSGKFKMMGDDVKNYIDINFANDNKEGITIDSKPLYTAISKAKVCVAEKDVLRPVMGGIHFDFDSSGMSVVGTDSHSLMYCYQEKVSDINAQEMNMPLKTADIISSIIAQYEYDNTTFYINENSVEIRCGAYVVDSRLFDGRFPNYKAVIPHDNNIMIEFNRKGFIAALRRVLNFANASSSLVKIIGIKGNCYYLSSEDTDLSLSAKELVESNKPEEDFKIAFNGNNLLNILNTFKDESICIKAKAANFPILIQSEEDIHTETILMPLQIND